MRDTIPIFGALFFSLASLIYTSVAWFKNYTAYELLFYHFRETPPQDYKPGVLGCMWHFGRPSLQDLCGTIIDLAVKGYLKVREQTIVKGHSYGKTIDFAYRIHLAEHPHEGLQKYEVDLLNYIKEFGSEGMSLIDMSQSKEASRKFYFFFLKWRKQLRSDVEVEGFGYTGLGPYTLTQALSITLATSGLAIILMGFWAGAIPLTTAFFQMLLASVFNREWGMGPAEYRDWTAFRIYIKKLPELPEEDLPDLQRAESFLALSLPLDCYVEMGQGLERIAKLPGQPRAFRWIDMGSHLEGRDRAVQAEAFAVHLAFMTKRLANTAAIKKKREGMDLLDLPIIRFFYRQ